MSKNSIKIADTIGDAIAAIIASRNILAKALILPVLFYFLLDLVGYFTRSVALLWLLKFFSLIAYSVLAITVYRVLLKGREAVPAWGLRTWSIRESKFVLYVIVVDLFPYLSFYFLTSLDFRHLAMDPVLGFIFSLTVLFFIYYIIMVVARVSLIFPATALEHKMTFKDAWEVSSIYKNYLFLVIVIPRLLMMWIHLLPSKPLLLSIVNSAMVILSHVFFIAVLAIAYNNIQRNHER